MDVLILRLRSGRHPREEIDGLATRRYILGHGLGICAGVDPMDPCGNRSPLHSCIGYWDDPCLRCQEKKWDG